MALRQEGTDFKVYQIWEEARAINKNERSWLVHMPTLSFIAVGPIWKDSFRHLCLSLSFQPSFQAQDLPSATLRLLTLAIATTQTAMDQRNATPHEWPSV